MRRALYMIFVIIFIVAFILSGCVEKAPAARQKVYSMKEARDACIKLCKASKAAGMDLSSGPCLSNQVVKGWVCDIAHKPRIPADNNPENQCDAFLRQEVKNFIELDENCMLIQYYQSR